MELHLAAEQWRTASSSGAAKSIVDSSGVRYTELWRLPYLNPAKQLVVDPAHCILEGLVPRHFREVMGLAATSPPLGTSISHSFRAGPESTAGWSENDKRQISELHQILLQPLDCSDKAALTSKLCKRNLKPLVFICDDLNIRPQRDKALKLDWARALAEWVGFP